MIYLQTVPYNDAIKEAVVGSAIGSMIAALILFSVFIAVLIAAGFYVYFSMAWMTIARKLKNKNAWVAWIPIANMGLILQLGGFHWAWAFLVLIPILGWIPLFVLLIISHWRIFEKRKYPGWLGLLPVFGFLPFIGWAAGIAYLVVIGMAAWGRK